MEASDSRRSSTDSYSEPMPDHVSPMLAVLSTMPGNQSGYGFEFKWDGMRAVFFCRDGAWRLETRNFKDVTVAFPELLSLGKRFAGRSVVLDGEVVALDEKDRPSFGALQHRLGVVEGSIASGRALEVPVTYMIFDLLYLEGRMTTGMPYSGRRRLLEAEKLNGPHWRTPDAYRGEGDAVLQAARANRLEGIMAKRLDSMYLQGKRSRMWLKIKLVRRQEFVIGGWVPLSTGAKGVGSLLLGYYDTLPDQSKKIAGEQRLIYAGKVGTGFTEAQRRELAGLLECRRRETSPFDERTGERGEFFVEPELVAEVEYRGWTTAGILRQPSYKGLRPDKPSGDVVLESEKTVT